MAHGVFSYENKANGVTNDQLNNCQNRIIACHKLCGCVFGGGGWVVDKGMGRLYRVLLDDKEWGGMVES
jgi:hypothetical protein